MQCRDFERTGAAGLEGGERRLEHLLACRRCRRLEESYRETAGRVAAVAPGPGPLPFWQQRVRARLALREGRGRPWWAGARAWLVGYAVVALLFAAATLDGQLAEARLQRKTQRERQVLLSRTEAALAPLDLVEIQEDMAYQMIHVAHAWAHDRTSLAQARERAFDRLEERLLTALERTRRARGP